MKRRPPLFCVCSWVATFRKCALSRLAVVGWDERWPRVIVTRGEMPGKEQQLDEATNGSEINAMLDEHGSMSVTACETFCLRHINLKSAR
jgi:hypothetical protein